MKPITTLMLTLMLQSGFAQIANNTNQYNERNVYFQALKQYLNFRATDPYYSKLKQIDTLFVENEYIRTDSLLQNIGNTRIVIIDDPYTFLKSEKRKGVILYHIFPLELDNGAFSVSFVPFEVSIEKKRKRTLHYSNPGSYKVVFKFEEEQFHFIRVEDHGI